MIANYSQNTIIIKIYIGSEIIITNVKTIYNILNLYTAHCRKTSSEKKYAPNIIFSQHQIDHYRRCKMIAGKIYPELFFTKKIKNVDNFNLNTMYY